MPSDQIPHNVLHATSSSVVFWWIVFKCHYLSTEWVWVLQNPSASMSIGDLIITQWTRKSLAPVLRPRDQGLERITVCWRAFNLCWSHGLRPRVGLAMAVLPGNAGTVGAGEAPSSPPAATQIDSCWSVSVCQLNMVPLPVLSPWMRFLCQGTSCFLAALMEFRAKRCWEVRHSSEEHKVVWKKSVLLSYLKNIIKSWKNQQRGFFVLFLSPSPFQVWRPPGFPLPRIQSHKVGPSL